MKVATVVARFERAGGIERAAVETSIELKRRGYGITVFTSRTDPQLSSQFDVRILPTLGHHGSLSIFTFGVASRRILNPGGFDVVHAHGTESAVFDVMTFQSCHRAGLEAQRTDPSPIRSRRNFGIADRLRLSAEQRVFQHRRYRKIIAVSRGVKRELCAAYGAREEDICVIPNGVDPETFHPRDASYRTEARRRLGIPGHSFVLVFVANEFERKGLGVLIDTLSVLQRPDYLLLVAGRDAPHRYQKYAKTRRVEQQVRFLGSVTNLPELYGAGDAFVLPTSYEAFSLAMLEAASSGLPLVMTRVNGAEDFLTEGMNGFFAEREAEDLAGKILRLHDDEGLRTSMGVRAHESAQSFSWPVIANSVLNVYASVAGQT